MMKKTEILRYIITAAPMKSIKYYIVRQKKYKTPALKLKL